MLRRCLNKWSQHWKNKKTNYKWLKVTKYSQMQISPKAKIRRLKSNHPKWNLVRARVLLLYGKKRVFNMKRWNNVQFVNVSSMKTEFRNIRRHVESLMTDRKYLNKKEKKKKRIYNPQSLKDVLRMHNKKFWGKS